MFVFCFLFLKSSRTLCQPIRTQSSNSLSRSSTVRATSCLKMRLSVWSTPATRTTAPSWESFIARQKPSSTARVPVGLLPNTFVIFATLTDVVTFTWMHVFFFCHDRNLGVLWPRCVQHGLTEGSVTSPSGTLWHTRHSVRVDVILLMCHSFALRCHRHFCASSAVTSLKTQVLLLDQR